MMPSAFAGAFLMFKKKMVSSSPVKELQYPLFSKHSVNSKKFLVFHKHLNKDGIGLALSMCKCMEAILKVY
jgi:hypothetical protein